MQYDEIDDYVNQLFNRPEPDDGRPAHGEVLSGNWRIDRIDRIIEDAYNEAIWWHNQRISEGCDPRSGLRSLPYVPWDENIDGMAAMMGNGSGAQTSWPNTSPQMGKRWTREEWEAYQRKVAAGYDPYVNLTSGQMAAKSESNASILALAGLGIIMLCLCSFIMSLGEIVRLP